MLSLSQWADARRRLSSEGSAEPGQWITARAEYQREMMDAVSDPEVEQVVAMIASQLGKTDALILNTLGYYIDQEPSPILVVEPRVDDAKSLSKDRIAPMLRDTPCLRGKVAEARSRDSGNTTLHKTFPGGHVTLGGANSPAGLAMRPIRVLLCDEVDRYPVSAGTEGDPVSIATKRTSTFWNRKIILVSSPTEKGASRITKAYEATDQRRYFVPCPHCGHEQTLRWSQVMWDKDEAGQHLPHTAAYVCEECGALWSDGERWAAVKAGKWRATAVGPQGRVGFHLSAIASPWKRLAELVQEFLDAVGQPTLMQTFVNTVLAETWEVQGEAPEFERLYARREEWPASEVPAPVLFLTAGVDVQGDRLEARVWGWDRNHGRWLIERRIIEGNLYDAEPWDALTVFRNQTWRHASGAYMRLARLAVDIGGHHTRRVLEWAKAQRSAEVMAVRGDSRGGTMLVKAPQSAEVNRAGKMIKVGLKPWILNPNPLKGQLYGNLQLDAPLPGTPFPRGYVHLSKLADEEEIRQLTAEKLVDETTKTGFKRKVWTKTRDRNEALDCAVYAHAAAIAFGLDRFTPKQWDGFAAAFEAAVEAVEAVEDREPAEERASVALPPPPRAVVAPSAGMPRARRAVVRSGWA